MKKWTIRENVFNGKKVEAFGSKYLIGNGYLGYRGTLEEYSSGQLVACTLSGVYDRHGDSWREPVNAPNGLLTRLYAQGRLLCPLNGAVPRHEQSLNFRHGIHSRLTDFRLPSGNRIRVKAERFASLHDPHLLCLKYSFQASKSCALTLETGIDADVWDINGPHFTKIQSSLLEDALQVMAATNEGKKVAVAEAITGLGPGRIRKKGRCIVRQWAIRAEAGREYSFTKVVAVFTSLDLKDPAKAALQDCQKARALGYSRLLDQSRRIWDSRWAESDVQVQGDAKGQLALRYSIYHLLAIAPSHTDRASIPARGLSGQVYKGGIFWDTEMFMLPFFLYTQPRLARNLVRYRFHTLGGARRKAASLGRRGAYYAWESQETGDDACTLFNITDVFTNRPLRTYFRDKQIHISGDVAHGIWQYWQLTGDDSLLLSGGAEVLFECTRFFLSWAYFNPEKNRYELLDVTGPDEYHERVHNNAFTNALAAQTVRMALDCAAWMKKRHGTAFRKLQRRLSLEPDLARLKDFSRRLYVPAPAPSTRVIEQFDGYLKLEDASLKQVKSRVLNPHEYLGGGQGLATTTQVIKQADVIMLLNVMGRQYSRQVKKANWEFYEPRTEHGSSLSPCVYALVAAATGRTGWAYRYFIKTATIDLTGQAKQYVGTLYIGGSHPAANGGAWMAAVLGFGGVSGDARALNLDPHLPGRWKSLGFRLNWQGQMLSFKITRSQGIWVKADQANSRACSLNIRGHKLSCRPGKALTVALK